jgi:hypothetical protein
MLTHFIFIGLSVCEQVWCCELTYLQKSWKDKVKLIRLVVVELGIMYGHKEAALVGLLKLDRT